MNDELNLSFDAQAENKAIIDLNYYFTKYNMSNEELRNALLQYTNNDTYKGDDATASKEYVATREIGFIDDTLKLQQKLMHLYIHKSETFAEKVDSDPYARIDTNTLDEIQSDLRRLYYIFEGYDREFASIADDLQERYGHICNFTKPNGKPVLESLAAICGGDDPESGSIYETKQAIIKWNEEECAYANSVMLGDDIADFKWNIYMADEMLADIKVAEPSVNAIVLKQTNNSKVKSNSDSTNNVGAKSKKNKELTVEEKCAVVQEAYGFSDDEMTFFKANNLNQILSLYATRRFSSYDANIIYNQLKQSIKEANTKVGKMLSAFGWKEASLSEERLTEINATLKKYNIDTKEKICMFLGQCAHECDFGRGYIEYGHGKGLSYGQTYCGAGGIHITWWYGYQAFATYEILQHYPELSEYGKYVNPAHNNDFDYQTEQYNKIVAAADAKGIDISVYTDIAEKGADYVSENFAWESAGYFWDVGGCNEIMDNGGSADDVSKIINYYDTSTFEKRSHNYQKMLAAYEEVYE